MRILHVLNQFFGGVGGEEFANNSPISVDGPVGPGLLIEKGFEVSKLQIKTIICGDNFAAENQGDFEYFLKRTITDFSPDLVLAGPAFEAGRYGILCGLACKIAAQSEIPTITAMEPENPGVIAHAIDTYILPTTGDPSTMSQVIGRMCDFGIKLLSGEPFGSADAEGFIPRGKRRAVMVERAGYLRAVTMLLDKMSGRGYSSEIPVIAPGRVKPALPVSNLEECKLGMVTTGGLIPKGNPERQTSGNPDRYFKYSIDNIDEMVSDDWEAFHGGYYNITSSENPNYILPLPAVRELERTGVVGSVSPTIFTMPGVGTPIEKARRFGAEIAKELEEQGVNCCILVAT